MLLMLLIKPTSEVRALSMKPHILKKTGSISTKNKQNSDEIISFDDFVSFQPALDINIGVTIDWFQFPVTIFFPYNSLFICLLFFSFWIIH